MSRLPNETEAAHAKRRARVKENKVLVVSSDQVRLLKALCDAAQYDQSAKELVQRAQEENHDVQPVAEGSEEETEIWNEIHRLFDKIRLL